MKLLISLGMGRQYSKYYMEFKEETATLSDSGLLPYYQATASVCSRPTDLSPGCVEIITQYLLKMPKTTKVLDIVCGRGYLAEELAKLGFDVTGVDFILPDGVNSNSKARYFEGNILDISFQDNSFDVVISTHTLEHIIDVQKAVAELRRVCRQSLLVIVPAQREYRYTFDLHVHFFPYCESLQRLMQNPHGICRKCEGDLVYIENCS